MDNFTSEERLGNSVFPKGVVNIFISKRELYLWRCNRHDISLYFPLVEFMSLHSVPFLGESVMGKLYICAL